SKRDWSSDVCSSDLGPADLALFVVDAPDRASHGDHFDRLTEFVEIVDVLLCEADHEVSTAPCLDEPLGLELAQRVTDRTAAHVVLRRECVLDEMRPRPQATSDDLIAQHLGELFTEGGRPLRSTREHRPTFPLR